MNKGRAEEYDHPFKLLVKDTNDTTITNREGFFSKMVLATGKKTAQSLFEIARMKYMNQNN